ncbi:MAG: efflux RND transporter periplasmic adaptor subunit [Acidobacteriota bacterium]|nr:efflux RND transporter periplasmic adaptor subunit [Acidobacteriota bacterium]
MQFNKTFLALSILVIAVLSVTIYIGNDKGWFKSAAEAEAETEGNKAEKDFASLNKRMGGKETPIDVEAAPIIRGTLIQRVSTQGRVHAYNQTDILNEVSGYLLKLNVRDGDMVKKGQVIAEIDDREYKLSFDDSYAKFVAAKADLVTQNVDIEGLEKRKFSPSEAFKELEDQYAEGLISRQEYEKKKLNYDIRSIRSGERREEVLSAKFLDGPEIAMKKAALTLAKCKVRAPFDGQIFGVEVSEGQLLNASTKICRLVGMDDLVIKAQVLESEVGNVFVDRPAKMKFTALPDLGWVQGKVTAVSPFVNEEEKTVETIVQIDSKDPRIRPGMFAEVEIDSKIYEDKLLVPKQAIIARDNRKVIFKVGDDNRAKWIYVKTGVANDALVEILDGGLQPGESVLTDNHFTMGHDTLVKIKNKK